MAHWTPPAEGSGMSQSLPWIEFRSRVRAAAQLDCEQQIADVDGIFDCGQCERCEARSLVESGLV